MGHLFKDTFQIIESLVLIPSLGFVGIFIGLSIIYSQRTLKMGKAHILGPLRGVPTQIFPVLIHFLVFGESILGVGSLIFLFLGLSIIIIASFILGKRQTDIENL